jgi:glycosyltransferase involved in cell wall biosynthesis
VLVTVGDGGGDEENYQIHPYLNPTGLLRVLGFTKLKAVIDKYLFFPSRNILYVKAVQKRLVRSIAKNLDEGKKVCVLTTVPPHDLCLVGLFLKKRFPEIQWITDWQDLWSYDETYFHRVPSLYRHKLLTLEREILAHSDINVTTNGYAKQVLEQEYHIPSDRVVAINHLFNRDDLEVDESDIANPVVQQHDGTIKIGFLGNFFKPPKVPGERVIEAIHAIRGQGLNVELHVYGDTSRKGREMSRQESDDGVIFHERTGHIKSLGNIMQCDFLLLLLGDLPNCRAIVPQKLAHYLMLDKPILAIVPEPSAVADIIKNTGRGYVLPIDSGLQDGLVTIIQRHEKGDDIPVRNDEAIKEFSIDSVTQQWLRHIGEV